MPCEEWFDAARNGHNEHLAELLAQQPDLIDLKGGDAQDQTALHFAAREGHEKVVALLLAARPALAQARTRGFTALDLAANNGHDKVVAQLLAAGDVDISAGLFRAIVRRHDKVVDLLLNARGPISAADEHAIKALFCVVDRGDEKVFAQLLSVCPDLIDALGYERTTVLHHAAVNGHDSLVAQILTLRPQMIEAADQNGWNALMHAVYGRHQKAAEKLLDIKPDLIFSLSHADNTILHLAVLYCDLQFVAKLWRLSPRSLTHANSHCQTPFYFALLHNKDELVELFQWSLSFDEIVTEFTRHNLSYQQRYRPVMERQCGPLFDRLNQDVAGPVFEYLGFDPVKRGNKRTREDTTAANIQQSENTQTRRC